MNSTDFKLLMEKTSDGLAQAITSDPAMKKAFLKEYRENEHLYKSAALSFLAPSGRVSAFMTLPPAMRGDALRVAAVCYTLLACDKPNADKFFTLLGEKTAKAWTRQLALIASHVMSGASVENAVLDWFVPRKREIPDYSEILLLIFSVSLENKARENKTQWEHKEDEKLTFETFAAINEKLYEIFEQRLFPFDTAKQGSSDETTYLTERAGIPFKSKDALELQNGCAARLLSEKRLLDLEIGCWPVTDTYALCNGAAEAGGVNLPSLLKRTLLSKEKVVALQSTACNAIDLYQYTNGDEKGKFEHEFLPALQAAEKEDASPQDKILGMSAVSLYENNFSAALCVRLLSEQLCSEVKENLRVEFSGGKKGRKENDGTDAATVLQRKLDDAIIAREKAERALSETETLLMQSRKRESALFCQIEKARLEKEAAEDDKSSEPPLNEEPAPAENECPESADCERNDSDAFDYRAFLSEIFSQKKIGIVGGNENLIKKFRQRNPDAIIVEKNKAGTCDQTIRGCDIVLFKSDSISHLLYNKCKSIAQKSGIPFGYIANVASPERMEKSVYEALVGISDEFDANKGVKTGS